MTSPAHGFGRYSNPSSADQEQPLPPPMSPRVRRLSFGESSGRKVNPPKPLTAVRLASTGVRVTFGVVRSIVFDRVRVRRPAMIARFLFGSLLKRYDAPASKVVLCTCTSPWTTVASG